MRLSFLPVLLASLVGCGGVAATEADANDFVVTTTPFDVPAGQEMLICQTIPSAGVARWFDAFNVVATPGMHHVNVYRVPDDGSSPRGPIDCTDDPVPTTGMLPPTPRDMVLPDGVAYEVHGDEALLFNTHFINTTSSALRSNVRWTAHETDGATVTASAGILMFGNRKIYIPPRGSAEIDKTCDVPMDLHAFLLAGHFHLHTRSLVASVGGVELLHITEANPDRGVSLDPPLALTAGEPVHWTCDDENPTSDPIVYGNSVVTNEMCQLSTYVFPVADSGTLRCDAAP